MICGYPYFRKPPNDWRDATMKASYLTFWIVLISYGVEHNLSVWIVFLNPHGQECVHLGFALGQGTFLGKWPGSYTKLCFVTSKCRVSCQFSQGTGWTYFPSMSLLFWALFCFPQLFPPIISKLVPYYVPTNSQLVPYYYVLQISSNYFTNYVPMISPIMSLLCPDSFPIIYPIMLFPQFFP